MRFQDLDVYAIGDTIQMAGAIYIGEGRTFLVFLPGETLDLPQETIEMTADDWKKFLFQTDVLETVIIEKASDGTVAKAIVRKSQRLIDNVMQWKVWKRDGYRCRYCGNDNTPLTVDHLVLWEEGGPSVPENLVSACKKCNKIRGNIEYSKWLSHPYYRDNSKRLTEQQRAENIALIATLPSIPRYMTARSR
jgi:hypothetical protein